MIRLTVPSLSLEDISPLKEIIESGWLTKGPHVEKFERQVAEYVDVTYAVAVNSGTSALHLALLAAGIQPEDEVIVPDFTFPATANVVEMIGGKAVPVDIRLETLNLDPDEVEQKVTERTRAIMPVHQFGLPADMDAISDIAKRNELKIIEDSACALGAAIRNRKCGGLGNAGCVSLHPRKIITTGEGGVVLTNDSEIYKTCRALREHGAVATEQGLSFEMIGYNYRMPEISAVLGVSQLGKIQHIIDERRKIAAQYKEVMSDLEWIGLPLDEEAKGIQRVYQSYVVLIHRDVDTSQLIQGLKQRGIETTIGSYSIHSPPYYHKKYGFKSEDYPNSTFASTHSLCLPLHEKLSEEDLSGIRKALESVAK